VGLKLLEILEQGRLLHLPGGIIRQLHHTGYSFKSPRPGDHPTSALFRRRETGFHNFSVVLLLWLRVTRFPVMELETYYVSEAV
jgi:hypothetical protein